MQAINLSKKKQNKVSYQITSEAVCRSRVILKRLTIQSVVHTIIPCISQTTKECCLLEGR